MAIEPRSRWRKACEHWRWRGPTIFALYALRKLLRLVVDWDLWNIYETDISDQVPVPYGKDELTTRICGIVEKPEDLTAMFVSMGELEAEEVAGRLSKGHLAAVAFSGEQPVGYMWLAFSSGPEMLFDTYWIVRAGEAVRYNSYVIPTFRGRGVHSVLNTLANCYAKSKGVTQTVAAVSLLNPQSLSLPKHYRRAVRMTVFLARVRWMNWTIRKAFGAPLESRFTWPNQKRESRG
jgi:GNAT superfamily N-acetyltransferase